MVDRDGSARWPRIVLEVVAWIVLVGLLGISLFAIAVTTHFECGGTLGGFGESANARLDDECVDGRAWIYAIPFVVLAGIVTVRLWSGRRSGR